MMFYSLIFFKLLSVVFADRVVMTNNGPLQGITVSLPDAEVEAFLGIPYAEPPLGRLRFQKPVPKSSWLGVYDASKLPEPCIQNATQKYYYMPDTKNMTEDCLYLNVWVPSNKTSKLRPIMIWIHGGAFNLGSSNMDIYDGSVLANYGDVIVASFNYRLGALGFLAAFIEDADGNMGIRDQILATRWIKDNAKSFGGDSNQITMLGESAGAMSIAGLLVAAPSQTLAKRVILESGGAIHPMMSNNDDRLLDTAQTLAKLVGCADKKVTIRSDPRLVVKCLKRLPATEISRAEGFMMKANPITFIPRTGDDLMPTDPTILLKEGNFPNTEILMGVNRDEGTLFLTAILPDYFGVYGIDNVQTITKKLAFQIIRIIFKATEQTSEKDIASFYINKVENETSDDYTKIISQALGDYLVTCNSVFHADFHSLKNNPVYFYLFSRRPSNTPLAEWMGSTHFDEVQYVFGKPTRQEENYKSEDIEISRRIMDRWLAFAKTGNPNIPGEIKWPPYSYDDPEYLDINVEETVHLRPDQYRCEFWRERFQAEINENLILKFKSLGVHIVANFSLTLFIIAIVLKWPTYI